jgi:creatinine amidohydrolase/Fe(II)-dependent formamide hydrolase-like protein
MARVLAYALVAAPAAQLGAQVLSVAELNANQVRALDRQKTVVILPGGILEEHGPFLPSYTDGFSNERTARSLAEAVAARPGWTALLFPPIPLGSGGANEIGRKYSFPGSFTVRSSTVRVIFMDLADELGNLGFRWVFVVHGHGSPHHNRALDDAGRYFQDTYGGRMVHLLGGMRAGARKWRALATPEALAADGFTVHAGLGEHSVILFLRPDLVPSGVREAPSVTVGNPAALEAAARRADWPGYFGAPRYATAALGAMAEEQAVRDTTETALKILDGQEPAAGGRIADVLIQDPVFQGVIDDSLAHEAAQEARQRAWLSRQPAWPPPPVPAK